ncbi:hypothetical protein [Variovorax sp. Sphag1AA]|uniref:hypothetical protein n=1 Tax=Variovorax sp. Sphag1AA TaxID=2587027 RepID=UPI00160750FC|nr:hypothetical protein [Variovorax sp. Sphag1AA]MBB3182291.1 hypothetical protein [Variovorax sp. Sphag1AA]
MEPIERPKAMFRLRTAFGWDAAYVAKLVDVTPRTVGLWETGAQAIPDARWRLFIHEVRRELAEAEKSGCNMVIVLADDGLSPIDAVSDRNYVSFELDGDVGFIASFATDRITKQPTIHQQRFRRSVNEHVVQAAEAWEAARVATAHGPDAAMLATLRWMTRQMLTAERANPDLRVLKDAVNAATREVDAAINGPRDILIAKLAEQDRAILALMEEIERSRMH